LRLVAVHTPSGALILDDTYNASPESTLAALNLLDEMSGRKIAVLGDMLELGPYERQGHEMIGARAAEVCNELIAVGERAKIIAETAVATGLSPSWVHWFLDVPKTIDFLSRRRFQQGEVILVKGSHGLRMDRIVAALEKE